MDERIEEYFNGQLSIEQREKFEEDLRTDHELTESVAFYLLVKNTAEQEAREKRLAEKHAAWQTLSGNKPKPIIRQLYYFVAAAMLLVAVGLGWYFLSSGMRDREELADQYVKENFSVLSVQMDGQADSLQQVISQYNKGNYTDAASMADELLSREPQNAEVQKIAGIVSLIKGDYDKAIDHFHQLGNQKALFSNPGRFYEAIARLQRGEPLDKKLADSLLKEVIDGNLEGKEEAVKWEGR